MNHRFDKHIPTVGEIYKYNDFRVRIIENVIEGMENQITMINLDKHHSHDIGYYSMSLKMFQELMYSSNIIQLDNGIERAITRMENMENNENW